jgi:hypothetical protein
MRHHALSLVPRKWLLCPLILIIFLLVFFLLQYQLCNSDVHFETLMFTWKMHATPLSLVPRKWLLCPEPSLSCGIHIGRAMMLCVCTTVETEITLKFLYYIRFVC